MTELWRLSAADLAARIRNREVSAREAARSALARLEDVNPAINAVVDYRPEQVLADADAVDARLARGEEAGVLGGVPVTVKVNTDQAGFASTTGLVSQRDLIATANNPGGDNLHRAGAVVLGRTNTPAFSYRWFTSNRLHGVTKNPWDPARPPGGVDAGGLHRRPADHLPRPLDALAEDQARAADPGDLGYDDQGVVDARRPLEVHLQPAHSEGAAQHAHGRMGGPRQPQQVRAPPLQEAHVAGVVDEAGEVGVLVIDPHRQAVLAPDEDA